MVFQLKLGTASKTIFPLVFVSGNARYRKVRCISLRSSLSQTSKKALLVGVWLNKKNFFVFQNVKSLSYSFFFFLIHYFGEPLPHTKNKCGKPQGTRIPSDPPLCFLEVLLSLEETSWFVFVEWTKTECSECSLCWFSSSVRHSSSSPMVSLFF